MYLYTDQTKVERLKGSKALAYFLKSVNYVAIKFYGIGSWRWVIKERTKNVDTQTLSDI
jgi:hypothetical protein